MIETKASEERKRFLVWRWKKTSSVPIPHSRSTEETFSQSFVFWEDPISILTAFDDANDNDVADAM